MFLGVGNVLRIARLLLSQLLCRQPSNYETRSISLVTMNARKQLYSYLYVPQRYIAVSFNKCTLCKSLWIKASAKCPKCKCCCRMTKNCTVAVVMLRCVCVCVCVCVCSGGSWGHWRAPVGLPRGPLVTSWSRLLPPIFLPRWGDTWVDPSSKVYNDNDHFFCWLSTVEFMRVLKADLFLKACRWLSFFSPPTNTILFIVDAKDDMK